MRLAGPMKAEVELAFLIFLVVIPWAGFALRGLLALAGF